MCKCIYGVVYAVGFFSRRLFSVGFLVLCVSFAFTNSLRIKREDFASDHVQRYLMSFGYMDKSADGAFALRTEESVRSALKDLQTFAGLPATGRLDERTVKLLKTPRCGLPDKDIVQTSGRRKRYAIQGQKWPFTNLTWSLRSKNLRNLDSYEVRHVVSKALEVWSRDSKLTFTEVDSDKADILIYFHRGDHGDNFAFDGPGVILAHAFFPNGGRSIDVHFDADEKWTTTGDSEQGTNLFNVAAHEFGHSLGLAHSNKEGALMYPWYTEMGKGFEYKLPEDDRLAIQFLYGSPTRIWEPIRPASTTTTTTTTTTRRPYYTRPHHPYNPHYPDGRDPYHRPHYPHKSPYPRKPMPPEKKPHHPKHDRYPYQKPERTPERIPPRIYPERIPPRMYPTRFTPTHPTYNPDKYPTRGPDRRAPERNPVKESPVPPDTCDTSYDSVAVIRREVFIFKDAFFWRIGDRGLEPGYPAEITRLWKDLPHNLTHVDAVYERPDNKIVFFIGKQFYVFTGHRKDYGYPRPLTDLGLPDEIEKVDGAMVWGHNGKTYFYSGDSYWRFDEDVMKVELDYPRNMGMWKGVGTDIDAVFQWKDGRTYFFKGKGFWKFNDLHMRVEHEEQKLSAPFWMGCTNNFENNDIGHKLPYREYQASRASSISSIFATIITVVFSLYKSLCNF